MGAATSSVCTLQCPRRVEPAINPQDDNVSSQLAASQEALFLGLLVSNYSLERHDKNPLDIRHLSDI